MTPKQKLIYLCEDTIEMHRRGKMKQVNDNNKEMFEIIDSCFPTLKGKINPNEIISELAKL